MKMYFLGLKLTRSATAPLLAAMLLCTGFAAHSVEVGGAVVNGTTTGAATSAHSVTAQQEASAAQLWGLSVDEVRRANALLKGPRANFSAPNLTPLEALGIHARNDAERQKYAEMFARTLHADTQRVLAWMYSVRAAHERLYPNMPVIDYTGVPAAAGVSPAAADAVGVPRTMARPVAPKRAPSGAQQ